MQEKILHNSPYKMCNETNHWEASWLSKETPQDSGKRVRNPPPSPQRIKSLTPRC